MKNILDGSPRDHVAFNYQIGSWPTDPCYSVIDIPIQSQMLIQYTPLPGTLHISLHDVVFRNV